MHAKRATSEPPPVPDQQPERRSIADPSKKAKMLAMLQIEPFRDNSAGCLRFPGKFRLLVKGDQWRTWYQNITSIPMNILEGLHHTQFIGNNNSENAWVGLKMPSWSFCQLHPGWIPLGLFAEQVLDNYVVDGHGER
jgi:hypothetical protein